MLTPALGWPCSSVTIPVTRKSGTVFVSVALISVKVLMSCTRVFPSLRVVTSITPFAPRLPYKPIDALSFSTEKLSIIPLSIFSKVSILISLPSTIINGFLFSGNLISPNLTGTEYFTDTGIPRCFPGIQAGISLTILSASLVKIGWSD